MQRQSVPYSYWSLGGVLISLPKAMSPPVGGNTTIVCDAWPVWRQTYGYLPSRKASPPIGWYQIILLGDTATCVLTTCPGLHSIAERPGFELATYWSQVYCPNHSATEPHIWGGHFNGSATPLYQSLGCRPQYYKNNNLVPSTYATTIWHTATNFLYWSNHMGGILWQMLVHNLFAVTNLVKYKEKLEVQSKNL